MNPSLLAAVRDARQQGDMNRNRNTPYETAVDEAVARAAAQWCADQLCERAETPDVRRALEAHTYRTCAAVIRAAAGIPEPA